MAALLITVWTNVDPQKCSKYYLIRTCRAALLFTDCRWHSKFRPVNESTRIILLPAVVVTLQHELPLHMLFL